MKFKSIHIILLITLLNLIFPLFASAPLQATEAQDVAHFDANDTWWDGAWPYRIPITVSGTGVAEVSVNFTSAFNTLGLNHALLDVRSIRVVPYDGTSPGNAIPYIETHSCLLYTSPSPRDRTRSRMPSSA